VISPEVDLITGCTVPDNIDIGSDPQPEELQHDPFFAIFSVIVSA